MISANRSKMENSAPFTNPGHCAQETIAMYKCEEVSMKGKKPMSIQTFEVSRGLRRNQSARGSMLARATAKMTHFTNCVSCAPTAIQKGRPISDVRQRCCHVMFSAAAVVNFQMRQA